MVVHSLTLITPLHFISHHFKLMNHSSLSSGMRLINSEPDRRLRPFPFLSSEQGGRLDISSRLTPSNQDPPHVTSPSLGQYH